MAEKLKIKIPTDLSDIKLSQYQKFIRTTKDSEDDKFINRQAVCIFCDIPDNIVGNMMQNDFNRVLKKINALLNEKPELKTKVNYNGVNLGFFPCIEDITVNEKADLDTYMNDWQTMDKAMKVMYRPIKSTYKDTYLVDDYKADGEGIDLTLDIVFGANVFFYNLMNDLLSYTQSYINNNLVKDQKVLQILQENGVGIKTFTHCLEEAFSDLKTLAN